jgi:hypothetical protein
MKVALPSRTRPIYGLLALLCLAGLFLFRDYGLTWDEPLFYKYADALGYAYTPAEWFGGRFDLKQAYGPSGDDHKNRGPAYLLLARGPVHALENLGLDDASAWHLANFATFVLGVYFVYRLCAMFAAEGAATAAAAVFAFQPLLWGHAFINPKDTPFLAFMACSVWLGFRMVDELASDTEVRRLTQTGRIVLPAVVLGLATSNRVLGPLSGTLVVAYFLLRRPSLRSAKWITLYAFLAAVTMLASWPYLWEAPGRLLDVLHFMSANPTVLPVLFADHIYRAYELPRRYLPFYLVSTLTEVVWPLFVLGCLAAFAKFRKDRRKLAASGLTLAWLVLPVAYTVAVRPPLYDGMRHFLFILPPIFVLTAIAFEFLFERAKPVWINILLVVLAVTPGLVGIFQLHPYEYAYYNQFVSGTGGAFRHYETDYWLTCYKEAVQRFNAEATAPVRLFVHREATVAAPYAAPNVQVLEERGAARTIGSGDFILVNTRANEDRPTFHDAPVILSVGRAGATFCVIKGVP